MQKDKQENKAAPVDVSKGDRFQHPCDTHDQDECVVEVVWPQGVTENGNRYNLGDRLVMKRKHAASQNTRDRTVLRFVRTLKYVNDPKAVSTAIDYEDEPVEGRVNIS